MAHHEFGLIEPEKGIEYNTYSPELYDCISVDDEIIEPLAGQMKELRTCFHSLDRPDFGLAYCGITLIPTSSLGQFQSILLADKNNVKNPELNDLIRIVSEGIQKKKYIIHFGI